MIRNLEATGVSSNSWGVPDNGLPLQCARYLARLN